MLQLFEVFHQASRLGTWPPCKHSSVLLASSPRRPLGSKTRRTGQTLYRLPRETSLSVRAALITANCASKHDKNAMGCLSELPSLSHTAGLGFSAIKPATLQAAAAGGARTQTGLPSCANMQVQRPEAALNPQIHLVAPPEHPAKPLMCQASSRAQSGMLRIQVMALNPKW